MIDHFVIGGFYRVHTSRGDDENLNAPGMHFVPLAFDQSGSFCDCGSRPDAPMNRFYTYGVLSRLAALAAAYELEQTAPMSNDPHAHIPSLPDEAPTLRYPEGAGAFLGAARREAEAP